MKKLFLWTAGLFGVIVVLAALAGPVKDREAQNLAADDAKLSSEIAANAEPPAPVEPEESVEPYNDPGISMAEFSRIQSGMSYEQATEIIGGPGEVISESDMAGYRTVMFQYEGERGFGANANLMFQNGKMIQKAQFGLQ